MLRVHPKCTIKGNVRTKQQYYGQIYYDHMYAKPSFLHPIKIKKAVLLVALMATSVILWTEAALVEAPLVS